MPETDGKQRLFEGVTVYHWMVLIIASCGWLFDTMDQRIFVLARQSALTQLLGPEAAADEIKKAIGNATMWMIFGWATGGIIFGKISDKFGRVKAMATTLLVYSLFTGLSGLAHTWIEFYIYRFLAGIGIGGMFGTAAAIVAESVPTQVRTLALGTLQALSACGNMLGALVSLQIPPSLPIELFGQQIPGWRVLFFVGILPAFLVIPVVLFLSEPESWKLAKSAAATGEVNKQLGTISDLFRDPRWRKRTIVGLIIGTAGMIGLWGIGFYTPELVSDALKGESKEVIDRTRSLGTFFQDIGAFVGMYFFTMLAFFMGRRPAFAISFIMGFLGVAYVFLNLDRPSEVYWMLALVGFVTLMPFSGYSIYFPELYPTRLRGAGIGFCYSAGRYLTAPSSALLVHLSAGLGTAGVNEPFRIAAVIMCSFFLLGVVALIWAPETKGKPLPEE